MTPTITDVKRKTGDGSKAATAGPLSAEELRKMDAYWRASNYLSVGQIYLLDNPLLKEPLRREHVKPRLLGPWATSLGLNMLLDEGAAHAEQLRGLYDAWGRGDFDTGVDLFAPDLEFITSEGFPDAPPPGEDIERVARWRDQFLATFQDLRIEALELEPNGERVLARVRQRGRFRATGIDVDVTYFQLWTFRGGHAARFQVFAPTAEDEARAAADT